jgi:transcriptional regulator NrdR family protein
MILDKRHNESKVDKVSGSLICDVCEQTFDTMESIKEHKASVNKNEGLKYKGID